MKPMCYENRNNSTDPLVDRDCVILDGRCDCPRKKGQSFPECKRYPTVVLGDVK